MQSRGSSAPLGATVGPEGVNFSLYSRDATGVELLLFDQHHAFGTKIIIGAVTAILETRREMVPLAKEY